MKQLFDISSDVSFYITLAFIFLINFSIAGCHILFTLLCIQLIVYVAKNKRKAFAPSIESGDGGQGTSQEGTTTLAALPKYYKYFLLYILFSFISALFAIDRLVSLKDNKEFFVFLLIPILMLVLNTRKRLLLSLYTILCSSLLSALIGIIDTLRHGISLDHRLKGLTSHWMTYSGLLMMVFIFFFVYLFYEKRTKLKLLLIPILLVILVAIFLSLTRSVWVGIFIALAIFIIYYKPKILYAAIPVAALLFVLPPNSVTNRVTSIFDMNNATNKDRFYMYRTGMKIFKDYPVTGVGPDNVAKIYDNYKPAEAVHSNPHLHNNFLHILAERGILTLGALVAAFFSIIFLLVSKIKQSIGFEKTVSLGVLFAFIGFLVAGLFEFNFGDTEMKFLLFFFISIPFLKFPAHKMDTADVPVHPQMEPEAKGIPDKKNQPNGDSQETSGPSPAPGGAA